MVCFTKVAFIAVFIWWNIIIIEAQQNKILYFSTNIIVHQANNIENIIWIYFQFTISVFEFWVLM